VHVVTETQTRFDDHVAGISSNCSNVQVAKAVHIRSEVAVGAIDWYWPAPQVVKPAQVRSLVSVARTDSYWLAEHVVSAAQVRSDEDVAATISYCHWVQTVKAWQGSVIDTRYWPAGQPYGSTVG
jgi:hypothetical protein